MSKERPVQLRRMFIGVLENIVPGLQRHRIMAEKASRFLDYAYSTLGGETGDEVTLEQVTAVLSAELGVLKASFRPNPQPYFIDEDYIKEALKLHTRHGLHVALTFMYLRADFWRDVAMNQSITELDSKSGNEAQRRANACVSAWSILSDSMPFDVRP